MYADTGISYPCYQNFYQELQPLDDFWDSHRTSDSMNSAILEYDLGAEGDLFKAPEPIIEEQMIGLDPMMDGMSMVVGGGEMVSGQTLKVADIELMQNGQLLSEVFCEFKKDLMANEATGTPLPDALQIQIPVATDENPAFAEEKVLPSGNLLKNITVGCLSPNEWIHGNPMRPNFMDYPGIDYGDTYGMRRSFSEGDIKTIGNDGVPVIESPLAQPRVEVIGITELRREKLSRYRTKRTKRNFGRKIKYACRKALADTQPRIRGRFAKTEECNSSNK